jgi:hypothetical protein
LTVSSLRTFVQFVQEKLFFRYLTGIFCFAPFLKTCSQNTENEAQSPIRVICGLIKETVRLGRIPFEYVSADLSEAKRSSGEVEIIGE